MRAVGAALLDAVNEQTGNDEASANDDAYAAAFGGVAGLLRVMGHAPEALLGLHVGGFSLTTLLMVGVDCALAQQRERLQ